MFPTQVALRSKVASVVTRAMLTVARATSTAREKWAPQAELAPGSGELSMTYLQNGGPFWVC